MAESLRIFIYSPCLGELICVHAMGARKKRGELTRMKKGKVWELRNFDWVGVAWWLQRGWDVSGWRDCDGKFEVQEEDSNIQQKVLEGCNRCVETISDWNLNDTNEPRHDGRRWFYWIANEGSTDSDWRATHSTQTSKLSSKLPSQNHPRHLKNIFQFALINCEPGKKFFFFHSAGLTARAAIKKGN